MRLGDVCDGMCDALALTCDSIPLTGLAALESINRMAILRFVRKEKRKWRQKVEARKRNKVK